MTRAFYYASTVRNAKDIAQYIIHPIVKVGTHMALLNRPGMSEEAARDYAEIAGSLVGGLAYTATTAMFQGVESQFLDKNARCAVAAELGKKTDDIKFSDYLQSNNTIVARELADAKHVNKWRYATDALFFIPAGLYAASAVSPKFKEVYQAGRFKKDRPEKGAGAAELLVGSFNLWDVVIYGAKAAYWMYETYKVDKTAHYEIVKVYENIESVGKKFTPNDLVAVINRSREDRGLTQIQEKVERDALWPILEHLADKMNHSKEFGVPELLYLVGLNKINIFELDQQGNEIISPKNGERKLSQKSISQTMAEIDKVAAIGLTGIAAENRAALEQAQSKGFVAGDIENQLGGTIAANSLKKNKAPSSSEKFLADTGYSITSGFANGIKRFTGAPRRHTEFISSRDGGDVPQQMA